jgi:hypothetical protein
MIDWPTTSMYSGKLVCTGKGRSDRMTEENKQDWITNNRQQGANYVRYNQEIGREITNNVKKKKKKLHMIT